MAGHPGSNIDLSILPVTHPAILQVQMPALILSVLSFFNNAFKASMWLFQKRAGQNVTKEYLPSMGADFNLEQSS